MGKVLTVVCCVCGNDIEGETEKYEQEECYEINEDIICGNCILKYIKRNCWKRLPFCED